MKCAYLHRQIIFAIVTPWGWGSWFKTKLLLGIMWNVQVCKKQNLFLFPTHSQGDVEWEIWFSVKGEVGNRNMTFLCRSEDFMHFSSKKKYFSTSPHGVGVKTISSLQVWPFHAILPKGFGGWPLSHPHPYGCGVRNMYLLCKSAHFMQLLEQKIFWHLPPHPYGMEGYKPDSSV